MSEVLVARQRFFQRCSSEFAERFWRKFAPPLGAGGERQFRSLSNQESSAIYVARKFCIFFHENTETAVSSTRSTKNSNSRRSVWRARQHLILIVCRRATPHRICVITKGDRINRRRSDLKIVPGTTSKRATKPSSVLYTDGRLIEWAQF